MKHTYITQLPQRIAKLVVEEEKHRIILDLSFSKYGQFNDDVLIVDWMENLVLPYEKDNRPFVMRNGFSGEIATIFNGVAVVQ